MNNILIFGMTENPGGVESFLMSYIRKINRGNFKFDFLCNSHDKIAYEDELISYGCEIYHITARSKDYKKYKREMQQFFKENASQYDTIWVNVCSLANIDYLKYAKKYGIKNISGNVIHISKMLTTSDVRVIKWLTGYTVDANFNDSFLISEDWIKNKSLILRNK